LHDAQPSTNQRAITVRAGTVAAVVGAAAAFLTLAGLAGQWVHYALGVEHSYGLVRSFDLDQEGNLATWFSVALLLANSLLFAAVAATRQRERKGDDGGRRAWAGLALLFLAMSAEEAAAIHEMTVLPLRQLLNAGGLLYYTWVVPGGILTLCIAAAYIPFLARLPARTRRLFVLAGLIYVGGAVGFEMIGGRYASLYSTDNFRYALIAHAEETLEMSGLVVLLYALLDYLGRCAGPISFRVSAAMPAVQSRQEQRVESKAESRRSPAEVTVLPVLPPAPRRQAADRSALVK
jgi:hypothetical protein